MLNMSGSDTNSDKYFPSLEANQGSLNFNSPSSEMADTFLKSIPCDQTYDRVSRCFQDKRERPGTYSKSEPRKSFESLMNMLYFDGMSLQDKHFGVNNGDEIHTAADMRNVERNRSDPLPSFYDEILPSFYCGEEDPLDESRKFREYLQNSQSLKNVDSNVGCLTSISDSPTKIPMNSSSGPRIFQLGGNYSAGEENTEDNKSFRLITEEEFNKNRKPKDVSEDSKNTLEETLTSTYVANHLSFPSTEKMDITDAISIPDCSITNLEHPSYLKSFGVSLKANNENSSCNSLRKIKWKQHQSSNVRVDSRPKPVIVGYRTKFPKEDLNPRLMEGTRQTNINQCLLKDQSIPSTKISKVKRNFSDAHALNIVYRQRCLRKNQIRKCFSDTSHSCSSLYKLGNTAKYISKKPSPVHRVHKMYNLEVASMLDFAIEKQHYDIDFSSESIQSEPAICKRRAQSLDQCCSNTLFCLCDQTASEEEIRSSLNEQDETAKCDNKLTGNRFRNTAATASTAASVMYPDTCRESSDSDEGEIIIYSDKEACFNISDIVTKAENLLQDLSSEIDDSSNKISRSIENTIVDTYKNNPGHKIIKSSPDETSEFCDIAISLSEEASNELRLSMFQRVNPSENLEEIAKSEETFEEELSSKRKSNESMVSPNRAASFTEDVFLHRKTEKSDDMQAEIADNHNEEPHEDSIEIAKTLLRYRDMSEAYSSLFNLPSEMLNTIEHEESQEDSIAIANMLIKYRDADNNNFKPSMHDRNFTLTDNEEQQTDSIKIANMLLSYCDLADGDLINSFTKNSNSTGLDYNITGECKDDSRRSLEYPMNDLKQSLSIGKFDVVTGNITNNLNIINASIKERVNDLNVNPTLVSADVNNDLLTAQSSSKYPDELKDEISNVAETLEMNSPMSLDNTITIATQNSLLDSESEYTCGIKSVSCADRLFCLTQAIDNATQAPREPQIVGDIQKISNTAQTAEKDSFPLSRNDSQDHLTTSVKERSFEGASDVNNSETQVDSLSASSNDTPAKNLIPHKGNEISSFVRK